MRAGIRVFTLQTGRLHAETMAVLDAVDKHYGYKIEQFTPDPEAVENYVRKHGLNGFYDSTDARKLCCGIRKVEPLNRALSHADARLTGQRREQAVTRADLPFEEVDEGRGIPKFNPLADWSEAEVWAYLKRHRVPVNALHAKGYPSIGCEPCTRAVRAGEDVRAGRWWWESRTRKSAGSTNRTSSIEALTSRPHDMGIMNEIAGADVAHLLQVQNDHRTSWKPSRSTSSARWWPSAATRHCCSPAARIRS